MTIRLVFGNSTTTKLLKMIYEVRYNDLAPFQAIRHAKLTEINMQDTTY
jgi:hypothetical protein